MTPREPDRYDKQAEQVAETWTAGHVALVDVVAAALRAAEASALERAARVADSHCPVNTTGHVCTPMEIAEAIRALLAPSPEAPPAKAESHAFDPSWFNDISQSEYCEHCGKTRAEHVPPSEPVAPAPSAAEKRIAELEAALREARGLLGYSGGLHQEDDAVIARVDAVLTSPGVEDASRAHRQYAALSRTASPGAPPQSEDT